jgi:hypothetical protein
MVRTDVKFLHLAVGWHSFLVAVCTEADPLHRLATHAPVCSHIYVFTVACWGCVWRCVRKTTLLSFLGLGQYCLLLCTCDLSDLRCVTFELCVFAVLLVL